MSPEMIVCGHLAVIMKCPFRVHYEDFLQYATQQVRRRRFSYPHYVITRSFV